MLLNELMNAVSFSAQHKHSREVVGDFGVEFTAALVHAVNPETGSLELLQGLRDVADADYGKVLQRAGCRLGHGFGETGGAPFRHQNACSARGVRGPDDGAKIVRIFDAIENQQQLCAGKDILDFRIISGCAEGDHALMRHASARAIQGVARFKSYRYVVVAAEIDDLLQARPAGAAGNQNAIDGALRLERFPHRMNTGDGLGGTIRTFSVVAIC